MKENNQPRNVLNLNFFLIGEFLFLKVVSEANLQFLEDLISPVASPLGFKS